MWTCFYVNYIINVFVYNFNSTVTANHIDHCFIYKILSRIKNTQLVFLKSVLGGCGGECVPKRRVDEREGDGRAEVELERGGFKLERGGHKSDEKENSRNSERKLKKTENWRS